MSRKAAALMAIHCLSYSDQYFRKFFSYHAITGHIFDLETLVQLLNDSHPQKQLFYSLHILYIATLSFKAQRELLDHKEAHVKLELMRPSREKNVSRAAKLLQEDMLNILKLSRCVFYSLPSSRHCLQLISGSNSNREYEKNTLLVIINILCVSVKSSYLLCNGYIYEGLCED